MIQAIISKLATCFSQPEEVILAQDDDSNEMYFISSGDCAIDIRDVNREKLVAEKLLIEGDHFGEIGVIYDCKRTATVVSRNYNTMARITSARFHDLSNEIPKYVDALKRQVFQYDERFKRFMMRVIAKIPYFNP